MKPLFFAAFLSLFLSAGLRSQAQNKSEEAAVDSVLARIFDGMSARDVDAIRKCSTNDLMILESGLVWNLDTIANKINLSKTTTAAFTRINHLDFIRTEIKGNMAWVAYRNGADVIRNGQKISKRWMESAILVKEGKDWKIQLIHSTTVDVK